MLISLYNRFAASPSNRVKKARRQSLQRCQATTAIMERLEERRLLSATSASVVINGDFEAGNTSFTTDMKYSPTGVQSEGTYAIVTSPRQVHGAFASYGDHTSGTGRMMVVNGSPKVGQVVWGQTVSVTPNTTYDFVAYVSSAYPTSPARLVFNVNGTVIGTLNASSKTGQWDLAFGTWNSGSATSATITIQNANTAASGNDFALDDIYFGPTIFSGPSNTDPEVAVNSTTIVVNEGQTATISGTVSDADSDTVALSASIGSVTNNGDGTWSWSLATDDGPADGTGVTISGDDGNGGTADAAFTVIVNNVALDASVSAADSGLVGDAICFTLGATDVSDADQAAGFTYAIDWDGDGTVDQTVSGTDGLGVDHTFATGGSTTVIVTATDKDGGTSSQVSHTIELIQPVSVDVKPGNSKNNVNAKSQGKIAVAIYTTDDFDASTVNADSVQLAGVSADHYELEDVDNDGDLDLVLHFETQAILDALGLALSSGDEVDVEVGLTGETIDQVMIEGTDFIHFSLPGNTSNAGGNGKGKNK